MVTIREIAWAAGVYEGEGSFSGDRVVIVQKDPWILHKLVEIFKFGTVRDHGDTCRKWCVSGQDARQFLLTIFTELSPRRKATILANKIFFIDNKFRQQQVCRNGHIKTEANTLSKRTGKNRGWKWNTICLDCMVNRRFRDKGKAVN